MLLPELVQAHFHDLRRAFQLAAQDNGHLEKLPPLLIERLIQNGYMLIDTRYEGKRYYWSEGIWDFFVLYAAWQEKLTAFISTMEGDKE